MLILIPIVNYSKQLQCMVIKRLNNPYGFGNKIRVYYLRADTLIRKRAGPVK